MSMELAELVFPRVPARIVVDLVAHTRGLSEPERQDLQSFVYGDLGIEDDSCFGLPDALSEMLYSWALDLELRSVVFACRSNPSTFDVHILWRVEVDPQGAWMKTFQAMECLAATIAQRYGLQEYYGGFDPACDEDMRIFSGPASSKSGG